jgi:nucleoside 2-deoxyribosyltransferase
VIKRETRKNIIDHFDMEGIHFSGRMSDMDFLGRLYDLKKLPSHDPRHEDAAGDIWQHSVNNNDYEGNWVFGDDRFGLLNGSHETFLKFICDMAHPLVRPDTSEANRITVIANDWLREDGWELYPVREIAGGRILSFRQINAIEKPKESEVAHIWEPSKLRFFISHRDKHKAEAKQLGEELKKYGISSFVAHDSIQAMSTWKHEIMKALQTMDACLCFITSDFYDSEWTNQEVGFALARGIPIYLYSVDKTDPKGFKLDTQAIKTGTSELVNCIKRDFSSNSSFKRSFIDSLIEAKDGSFNFAKDTFCNILGITFNDPEIEEIIKAVTAKSGESERVNKLQAILLDGIEDRHKNNLHLRNYSMYREYFENNIVSHHTTKSFTFQKIGDWEFKVTESRKKRK